MKSAARSQVDSTSQPALCTNADATAVSTIQAAVRVRPLVSAEAPQDSIAGQPSEVIRVVTAAGRVTRPIESPYMLEVLQPPPAASSTSRGIPNNSAKRDDGGRLVARGGNGTRPLAAGSDAAMSVQAKAYAFDFCAGPATTQAEFFALLDMPAMCEAALEGQVVTVFCFGQTGSGKTFTLSGRTLEAAEVQGPDGPLVSEDGLQYQATAYVARRLKEMRHAARRRDKERRRASKHAAAAQAEEDKVQASPAGAEEWSQTSVTAKCSYVELYQETLYDLLQPESEAAVKCRWSAAAQSFYVEGSLLVECRSHEDFLMVLREGQRNRQRGSHALNRDSSRSHVVYTIFFERSEGGGGGGGHSGEDATHVNAKSRLQPPPQGQEQPPFSSPPAQASSTTPAENRRFGRLVFVDLAGSERLKKSQSTSGAETGAINKSLFTLGHVLELLSAHPSSTDEGTSAGKPPFIPYRSSVLTQLLMHSLDGHGRTLMIACVSPSAWHLEESLRTLHYAQRARHIRTTPLVHVDAATQQRLALEAQVTALRRENGLLRRALGLPHSGALTEAAVYARVAALSGGVKPACAVSTAPDTENAVAALPAAAAAQLQIKKSSPASLAKKSASVRARGISSPAASAASAAATTKQGTLKKTPVQGVVSKGNRASAGVVCAKGQKSPQAAPSSLPLTPSPSTVESEERQMEDEKSQDDGEVEECDEEGIAGAEEAASPQPWLHQQGQRADGRIPAAPVNIMALLDALPDTRSIA